MARTLANLVDTSDGQGKAAVDALVQAIVGEERRQDRRQSLLSEYYLDPSRRRSEEAASILKDAVNQAKETLMTLRHLNKVQFYIGLAVFIFGFVVAIFYDPGSGADALGAKVVGVKVLGVLAGMGGLFGVIQHMVKDPLDRIQNAVGNLVQMEAAFTSFMWELNLNQTFIQSRYVSNGYLSKDEIQSTVERVETSIHHVLSLVEIYTETGAPRLTTRLTNVSPVVSQLDKTITIHGQYLKGDETVKKEFHGTLAIDHIPVNATIEKWNTDKVSFKLSKKGLDGVFQNGEIPNSVMVSLLVDGIETNALALRLMGSDGANGAAKKQQPVTADQT